MFTISMLCTRYLSPLKGLVFVAGLLFHSQASAIDVVKYNINRSENDPRQLYNLQVLRSALELTKPEYGAFELKNINLRISTARLLPVIVKGDDVNVAIAVTRENWEQALSAIRIPIRRGILSYRLLLINKDNVKKIKKVKTATQLKATEACLGRFWSTTKVMTELGFKTVIAKWDLQVLSMLNYNRCDFMPRGVHEIYQELDHYKDELPNLRIADDIALYIPAAFYVFVSPKQTRIYERLSLGLERMVEQGMLKDMVNSSYRHYLNTADIKNRNILYLGNPLMSKGTPLERKELWLRWDLKKTTN